MVEAADSQRRRNNSYLLNFLIANIFTPRFEIAFVYLGAVPKSQGRRRKDAKWLQCFRPKHMRCDTLPTVEIVIIPDLSSNM